jgi:hypothetical protein
MVCSFGDSADLGDAPWYITIRRISPQSPQMLPGPVLFGVLPNVGITMTTKAQFVYPLIRTLNLVEQFA